MKVQNKSNSGQPKYINLNSVMFCLLKAPEGLNQYYKSTVVKPSSALLYACAINLTIYTWGPLGAFKIMLPTEREKRVITVKELPA